MLAFVLLLSAAGVALVGITAIAVHFAGGPRLRAVMPAMMLGRLSANAVMISSALTFGAALLAASAMARIERRPLNGYGLPLAPAFAQNFAEGIAAGFVAITLVLAATYATGELRFDGLHETGIALVADAFGWAVAFVLLALSEEYVFRGYVQFTLTSGTRFWFAALLTSVAFALAHTRNHGETAQGVVQVVIFALVLCFALWRSGNLWFGIGLHAAWDWSETYFYGTPDSGLVTPHAFLATTLSGPAWLSGSTAGPEGSVFAIVALIAVGAYVWFRFPGQRYPARGVRVGSTTGIS